jgi:hypothetical protein
MFQNRYLGHLALQFSGKPANRSTVPGREHDMAVNDGRVEGFAEGRPQLLRRQLKRPSAQGMAVMVNRLDAAPLDEQALRRLTGHDGQSTIEPPMTLDDVTAQLLAEPLEQFAAKRNERVKELKASGQAELATEVAALRKPALPLWAANQAARADASALGPLRQAAEAVSRAQTGGGARSSSAAHDLRRASEAFQGKLDGLVDSAAEALRRRKHAAGEETMRRIREIFRLASLEGGDTWDRLKNGALISEPGPAEDVLSMFQAAGPRRAGKAEKSAEHVDAFHAAKAAEREARLDAERADQLEATARRLRQDADEAAAQAQRARQRAAAAEKEAAAARAQATKSARAVARRFG